MILSYYLNRDVLLTLFLCLPQLYHCLRHLPGFREIDPHLIPTDQRLHLSRNPLRPCANRVDWLCHNVPGDRDHINNAMCKEGLNNMD